MRIGLFSDTYHPSVNGIVYVVDSLKQHLESEGHEVFVFCPAKTLRPKKAQGMFEEDMRIMRIPSVPSGFFDDFELSLFFPPRTIRQIRDLDLDIIHIFTPSQIGLLGINVAMKYDIPFVVQHCTDLYEFVEDYPNTVPGALALVSILFPLSVKLRRKDYVEIAKLVRPRLGAAKWGQDIIKRALTMAYSKADAAIALSMKSQKQLEGWQDEDYTYDVTLLPSGVDALPAPSKARLKAFCEQWGLEEGDEVVGNVGRLAEEKNLPVLIEAFDTIGAKRPHAKLVFVGDFDYRKTLEAMAAASKFPDRIIFTGALPRSELGVAYAALDVFAFPSLKDTQAWVLNEAAHAGLPIVMIDQDLSEVIVDDESGFFVENDPTDFADKIIRLLEDTELRARFGTRSKQLARRLTESRQVKKTIKLYQYCIDQHAERNAEAPKNARRLQAALLAAQEAFRSRDTE